VLASVLRPSPGVQPPPVAPPQQPMNRIQRLQPRRR
jgi:hypothetical protein